MLNDLVIKNRSYRRFDLSRRVSEETLEELVDLARLCPSSRNQQALKFMTVWDAPICRLVYPCLGWAGYLKDWDGPAEEERPAAYIIILGDTRLGTRFETDLGICAQTIMLGAVERGLGGCMIASLKQPILKDKLKIPDYLDALLVLALGKPKETIVIDPIINNEIRYWRDDCQVHHVPKRELHDVLIRTDLL